MNDHLDLLGGARRGKTRPRGFIEAWKPRPETEALLVQIDAVLDEYRAYMPLTIRQIFYRLVGAHGYVKTKKSYTRLHETLNTARRAQRVPMTAIRDDGGQKIEPFSWADEDEFLRSYKAAAQTLRLDRQEGQEVRLFVMCELAGMAPQLANTVEDYGITVLSSGGFDSVTEKHRLAQELVDGDDPVIEVLHIGDHDPSGAHMFLALAEDVTAFAEALSGSPSLSLTFTRLAVIPDQIEALNLDTAPAAEGDNRAFEGETCQAEAIPPDVLADILRAAVEDRIDQTIRDDLLEREREIRESLVERLD